VVITDLDLPDGRGESILDAARAAQLETVPRLVVYSGSDDDERLAGLVRRGVSAYVRKPSPMGELLAAVFPESA
jgi:DNA-binding NarL/FixJ family response regulator